MSITLPGELLDAVIERTKHDNVTRSALTIKALTAYLEGRIVEPHTQDNTEVIRLRATLEGKDEIIKRADETIGVLRLALDIRDIKGKPREIEVGKQDSDTEKRISQLELQIQELKSLVLANAKLIQNQIKKEAPESGFEPESEPRQGSMIGRYTTRACAKTVVAQSTAY